MKMDLSKKKLELDLMKCKAAKLTLEYKVLEKQDEIERVQEHIKLQEVREDELMKELLLKE